VRAAAPDRTNRMNHVARRQVESRRDAALPRWTPHTGPHFGDRQTRIVELGSRGPMNGSVDAAAAEHPLIGRVDDRVNVELRDITTYDFNHAKTNARDVNNSNDSNASNDPNDPNGPLRTHPRT